MASQLSPARAQARWWTGRFDIVWRLEHPSLEQDETISRLRPAEMAGLRDLRTVTAASRVKAGDVLAWKSHADGPFGRLRLVALFLCHPRVDPLLSIVRVDDVKVDEPLVLCLDGPIGSRHRKSPIELCLYYSHDPVERRWTMEQGLVRLFDLARKHVAAEDVWRSEGMRKWPAEEAPHGLTRPALPDPSLRLPPPSREAA